MLGQYDAFGSSVLQTDLTLGPLPLLSLLNPNPRVSVSRGGVYFASCWSLPGQVYGVNFIVAVYHAQIIEAIERTRKTP